jgi:hypothetical protein
VCHKNCGGHTVPYTKDFRFRTNYPTYKQPQRTNLYVFCVCDAMFHFTSKNNREEQKLEVR